MAALQLVSDAAEQCDAGMAAALGEEALPRLDALLRHPDPVVRGGALRAAASLVSAALEAGVGPMALDAPPQANGVGGHGGGVAVRPLLGALKSALDVGGAAEVAAEVEEAALDAGGGWWGVVGAGVLGGLGCRAGTGTCFPAACK